jgi:hypothetical protein
MKSTPAMQKIINKIVKKYLDIGLDETVLTTYMTTEVHLHLDMPPFQPLVIERIGNRHISVVHYFEQNGDLVPDPDIVFYIDEDGWYPVEFQNQLKYQRLAKFDDNGNLVVENKQQRDVASFCATWAKNIIYQGWLENATPGTETD